MSGNKQDLIERLQSSLLDEGDDLLDQVGMEILYFVLFVINIQCLPPPVSVPH